MSYYLAIKTLVIFADYFSHVPKCSQWTKMQCEDWIILMSKHVLLYETQRKSVRYVSGGYSMCLFSPFDFYGSFPS